MRRRQALLTGIGFPLLLLTTTVTPGQVGPKRLVVGLLDAGDRVEWWEVFRQRLQQLGYVEGRNVTFEQRLAKGNLDALPAMANELVHLKVAAIVTSGVAAATAAKRATSTVPIVMASGTDQVSMGLVASLAHPGGNVTGVSSLTSELAVKRFELLREFVPKSLRLAVLWHNDNPASMASVRDLEGFATREKLSFKSFGIRGPDDVDATFLAMTHERVEGLVVIHSPLIFSERKRIAAAAQKFKLPAVYGAAEYADAGGLLSYAPSFPEMFREAAVYLDRILKGANPADMPIIQPSRFELVINSNTARSLGLPIPPSMLARASRIIE